MRQEVDRGFKTKSDTGRIQFHSQPVTTIDQNITLELLPERCAREETPPTRTRRAIGSQDRPTRDSLRLDRSVQEICWRYACAGSNPALSKPCIRADSQLSELIGRHRADKNKLLSLYPITPHNQCAKFGFLTQLDTNQTDSGQMNLLLVRTLRTFWLSRWSSKRY